MTLDSSARESNFRDSIKRHFVDNISATEGIAVTFDKALSTPNLQGKAVRKWVSVLIGDMDIGNMSTIIIQVYCCTRGDSEGFMLAQLRDTVMGYLSDTTTTDGMKRIPFYRSRPVKAEWTLLGALLVQEVTESKQMEAPDETKFKILVTKIRVPSKI